MNPRVATSWLPFVVMAIVFFMFIAKIRSWLGFDPTRGESVVQKQSDESIAKSKKSIDEIGKAVPKTALPKAESIYIGVADSLYDILLSWSPINPLSKNRVLLSKDAFGVLGTWDTGNSRFSAQELKYIYSKFGLREFDYAGDPPLYLNLYQAFQKVSNNNSEVMSKLRYMFKFTGLF